MIFYLSSSLLSKEGVICEIFLPFNRNEVVRDTLGIEKSLAPLRKEARLWKRNARMRYLDRLTPSASEETCECHEAQRSCARLWDHGVVQYDVAIICTHMSHADLRAIVTHDKIAEA